MASENEKRETLADLVAELRKESKKVRTVIRPDGYGDYEEITLEGNLYLKNLSDRIEEAWKRERTEIEAQALSIGGIVEASRHKPFAHRETPNTVHNPVSVPQMVGNAAAMREALVKCREIALQWQADEADGVAGTTDKPQARSAAEAVIDMEFEINAALSAPARNCDRRFASIKEARTAYCLECGRIVLIWDGYESRLFEDWLLASAAERKGEGNGR